MCKCEPAAGNGCIFFVSTRCRSWIAAKTIFLIAPDEIACSEERLAAFAVSSGWRDAAEEDGSVLVLPIAAHGWRGEATDRIKQLFRAVWKAAQSPDPEDARGTVWCWETLIFLVGFREGAVYGGNVAVAHPNLFADVALIDGVPDDFSAGERDSDQWLLPDASPESMRKNREIPVSVWFLGNADTAEAENWFRRAATDPDQVAVTRGGCGPDPTTTARILDEFQTRIRWKNSPDGTPARCMSEREFRDSGEYLADCIESNGYEYPFFVRVPGGANSHDRRDSRNDGSYHVCKSRSEAMDRVCDFQTESPTPHLPVVISLHGHGESARLFSRKNGWPELQDETGEFLFVLPDSPLNEWQPERDEQMLARLIDRLVKRFGADRTRVYLTGFSNGGMATCWYGTMHPELFAGLSPWNPPLGAREAELEAEGWQMPLFAVNGDKDHKIAFAQPSQDEMFRRFISLNGGTPRREEGGRIQGKADGKHCRNEIESPIKWACDEIWTAENVYTMEAGYPQGERLTTQVFHNADGQPRVCFTSVRDMPHGAIADEARAAWRFLRRFSRPPGSRNVVCAMEEGKETT